MNRRSFLAQTSLGLGSVVPAAGLFRPSGWAHQARPALSELTLAQYIQGARARGQRAVEGLVREVTTDVRSFLRNRFALASAQEAFVSQFAVGDLENIRTAFERGVSGLNEIRVRIPPPDPAGGKCRLRLEREFRELASGVVVEDLSLIIENR